MLDKVLFVRIALLCSLNYIRDHWQLLLVVNGKVFFEKQKLDFFFARATFCKLVANVYSIMVATISMHLELVQRMPNIEKESEIHVSFISFIEVHFTKYALSFAVNYSFTRIHRVMFCQLIPFLFGVLPLFQFSQARC